MRLNFNALYNHFARHKEGGWILKPSSAKALHGFVTRHGAKNVLELGTGIGLSTAIIAAALEARGGEYSITTVEQSEKCRKLAEELIPDDLRKNVKFHVSAPVLWEHPEFAGQKFVNFSEIPEGDYDLIVVDGPGPFLLEGRFVEAPNGDLLRLHLEGKVRPRTKAYFDGRIQALGAIERYYGGDFWLLNENNARHNAIERKDCPVTFRDSRLEFYRGMGYFNE